MQLGTVGLGRLGAKMKPRRSPGEHEFVMRHVTGGPPVERETETGA